MAEALLHEPEWLAARRERAASLRGGLSLPQFKGAAGWEFTALGKFDLSDFAPAPADAELAVPEPLFGAPGDGLTLTQVDGHSEAGETGADGVIVKALGVAAAEHPELVEPHLGTIVPVEDVFVAANDAGWACGAFVYVPRGVRVASPVLLNAVTAAAGSSPYLSSATPKQTASFTAGWASSACSISAGEMFSPPRMIISLIRPSR